MAEGNTIKNKIVLEGEAQYKKSITDINRALKENKSEVKAAALEYQNAGQSMEAAQRYSDALEGTLQNQISALEAMHEHLNKVEEAYGKNSREAVELRTKINNMRAEMAKTTSELNGLRDRMDATGAAGAEMGRDLAGASAGFGEVGRSAQEAKNDVEELSRSIGDMVGEKIIEFAVGKATIDAFKQAIGVAWNEAMSGEVEGAGMQARTAMTDQERAYYHGEFGDRMDREFAGFYTGKEVRDTIETGWNYLEHNPNVIGPNVEDALKVGAVFETSASDALRTMATLSNVYGEDIQQTFDIVAAGMQGSANSTGDLMTRLMTYGNLYAQMGYSVEQTIAAMGAAMDTYGVEKSKQMDGAVKSLQTNLTSGSKEVTEALKTLGIEATDLPLKLAEGGETAAAGYRLVLESLAQVEDAGLRDQLGKALFGDSNWILAGGENLAQTLLDGFNGKLDFANALDNAWETYSGTTQHAQDQAVESVKQSAGKLAEPFLNEWHRVLDSFNEGYEDLDIAQGIVNAISTLGGDIGSAITGFGSDFAGAGTVLGNVLLEGFADSVGGCSAEAAADIASSLDAQIADAFAKGDLEAAAQLQATGEAILGSYDEIVTQLIAGGMDVEQAQAAAALAMGEGFASVVELLRAYGSDLIAEEEESTGRWIDSLNARGEAAAEAQKSTIAALQEQETQLQKELEETTQVLIDSDMAGTYAESWDLYAKQQEIIAQLAEVRSQIAAEMESAGQEAADALSGKGGEWNTAASDNAADAISGVDSAQGDMQTAGEELGDQGVTGLESKSSDMQLTGEALGGDSVTGIKFGLSGMYSAGVDGANGAVSGLETGIGAAYNAGRAMGQAFEKGYRSAVKSHSPSRVMYDAAGDTTAGLFIRFDEDEEELRRRAEGLGDAVREGYESAAPLDGPGGGAGVDGFAADDAFFDRIAGAMREGLAGLTLMMDTQAVGELTEPHVSRATSARAMRTFGGLNNAAKGW